MFAAEIQSATLVRSLVIAAVIVSPYAVYKVRQVRNLRRTGQAAPSAEVADPGGAGPRLEDVIAEIDAIGSGETAGTTVTVPTGVTVDGDVAPAAVVDALVRDALRRSGLVSTAELDSAAGRVLEVRRRSL